MRKGTRERETSSGRLESSAGPRRGRRTRGSCPSLSAPPPFGPIKQCAHSGAISPLLEVATPTRGVFRGNHTLPSSPASSSNSVLFMSLAVLRACPRLSKRGCPPVARAAALRPALAIRGISSLSLSFFANGPVASRLVHTSDPAHAPETVPTSTTSPTEPITSLAIRGSNQHSLETPTNKAGTSLPHSIPIRVRHLALLVRICSLNPR